MSRSRLPRRWSEPSTGSAITATPEAPLRILAPTLLEAWVARRELRGRVVERSGVGLSRPLSSDDGSVIVLCGLAGSLVADLPPGSVVVPTGVGLPDGRRFSCHSGWVEALTAAAARLGLPVDSGPLLTAPSLVTGADRAAWAAQGYRSADMETGLVLARGRQVATVRVVLDTPGRSISDRWERPHQALWRPRLWEELLWMAWYAPRHARLAARIVREALP